MKRWWSTSGQPAEVRGRRRRTGSVLRRAVMAGAVAFPIPSHSSEIIHPRTAGAVIEAWAFGTLSDAKRPKSQEACDLSHVCELVISSAGGVGTGTGATIKTAFAPVPQNDPPPNLPFMLTETIDYRQRVTQGAPDNNCYPARGVMTIASNPSSTLVLDIVGQACRVGPSTAQLVFTGSYVTDAASTGDFANADGLGTANINNPSGLPDTGSNLKISLVGQLKIGS
jgi:hypothetical protein